MVQLVCGRLRQPLAASAMMTRDDKIDDFLKSIYFCIDLFNIIYYYNLNQVNRC